MFSIYLVYIYTFDYYVDVNRLPQFVHTQQQQLMLLHTSAYVSIRQSEFVSIRQHTSAYLSDVSARASSAAGM